MRLTRSSSAFISSTAPRPLRLRALWSWTITVLCLAHAVLQADDGYRLWLKYETLTDAALLQDYRERISSLLVAGESETCKVIEQELGNGLSSLLGTEVPHTGSIAEGSLVVGTPASLPALEIYQSLLTGLGREGFIIKSASLSGHPTLVIAANDDLGLLYGAFHLLRLLQTYQSLQELNIVSKPRIQYRLLNHWDNLDGSVERGYAGASLWNWDELPERVAPRYLDYARANASIGINGTVLNNVNADPGILRAKYLRKIARLAELFRPFGIRVFLSVNFSSPISSKFSLNSNRRGGIGDLETADPSSPEVRRWWREKVDEIYRAIPDFGGFLVKAHSEGMPGPQDYGRSHAHGANMLADALRPHGGVVMWRAFVYSPETDPDRAKRAYHEFVPLDGQFRANVFVQAKNGPIDFQPREPVQPLFGALPKTPTLLELQITQEYLGHSTHLVYLAPMWREYLDFDTYAKGRGSHLSSVIDGTLQRHRMTGIAGVANLGSDRNWCGHLFAQANWFAFGRLAWDHSLTAERIAEDWIRMTLSSDDRVVSSVRSMMMGSWEACVDYMTPLGLHHIMQEGFHYGPQPSHDQGRPDWTSVYYHRADSQGLGFDRSSRGSGAVSQYAPELGREFDSIGTCPERYLLWFHHVPWNHVLGSGRTLWEELAHRYHSGVGYVDGMLETWTGLRAKIDTEIFTHVTERLSQQQRDAALWRDVCLAYFQKFSEKPIPQY